AVEVSIHAMSPLLGVGGGAAAGAAAAAAAGAAAGAAGAWAPAAAGAEAAGAAGAASGFLSCASAIPVKARAAVSAIEVKRRFIVVSPLFLECVGAGLAGADADDLLEVEDEDLSVADLSGVGALLDRLDDAVEHVVLDRRLHLHLGKEVDHVLGAAIELGVAFLAAEAFHLGDGDPLHADRRHGCA